MNHTGSIALCEVRCMTGEDQIQHKPVWERMEAVLSELSEEHRQVLALRFGFGMCVREVAQKPGKSEGAIKMLQTRAIIKLHDRLNNTNTALVRPIQK